MDDVQLFVRFNNSTIPVTVNGSSTVQEIRSHISSHNNLTNSQVRIVFAGKELLDHQSLKDVDILSNTVVHAFQGTHLEARSALSTPVSRPVTSTKGKQSVPTYYVLCKRECKSVQPGKLRVRCVGCGEDNMILRTEPQGWSDVLQKGRVSGICHTPGCPGATPEFYFKCRGHTVNHHDYVVPLPLIKTNFLNVPCMTCMDEESDPLLVFPCSASHVMCLPCFKSYCIAQLNNRQFIEHDEAGYTVTCPGYDDPSCRNAVINDVHHFGVMGDDNYERYKQFGAEECVLKMGGVLCPGNDCGMGIFLEDETETHVQCSECGLDFCVSCKGEAHGDEGCDVHPASVSDESTSRTLSMYAVNVALSRWDKDSADTIRKTTKPCPNCGTPIEKSGGCMHMECPLARCAFSWCWICGGEWTPECQDNHWFG